jgi:hypothetical protein
MVGSIVAVVISIYALWMQRQQGHEVSTQTQIHAQYELCRALDQLRVEHPEVSHILALPSLTADDTWINYKLFKSHVRSLFSESERQDPGERAKFYLKEHAVALNVFDIYEQTVNQRMLAEKAGDKGRYEMLHALVDYYEKRMLRNPRLRFHWDHGGSDMLEADSRNYFARNVQQAFPTDPVDDKSPLES